MRWPRRLGYIMRCCRKQSSSRRRAARRAGRRRQRGGGVRPRLGCGGRGARGPAGVEQAGVAWWAGAQGENRPAHRRGAAARRGQLFRGRVASLCAAARDRSRWPDPALPGGPRSGHRAATRSCRARRPRHAPAADLGRPEHVFALSHPDLPATRQPLRSLDLVPNNLPSQLTSFVGREPELEADHPHAGPHATSDIDGRGRMRQDEARRTGRRGHARSLHGRRLVDRAGAAHRCAGAWPDDRADRRCAAVARTDAAGGGRGAPRAHTGIDRAGQLRAPARGMRAGGRGAAARCGRLSVLATVAHRWASPARSSGECRRCRCPGEAPAEPEAALAQSDAVRLFVERATQVRPNFTVDAAARRRSPICRDLDGIPLAIELAAARVRVLGVDQIAAGLERPLPPADRGIAHGAAAPADAARLGRLEPRAARATTNGRCFAGSRSSRAAGRWTP